MILKNLFLISIVGFLTGCSSVWIFNDFSNAGVELKKSSSVSASLENRGPAADEIITQETFISAAILNAQKIEQQEGN